MIVVLLPSFTDFHEEKLFLFFSHFFWNYLLIYTNFHCLKKLIFTKIFNCQGKENFSVKNVTFVLWLQSFIDFPQEKFYFLFLKKKLTFFQPTERFI